MQIRPASEADFPAVLDIVNTEIRHGSAHFGTTPNTRDDLVNWIGSAASLPWLVADAGANGALGFARAARWQSREGYDWTVTISVYVRREAQRRGVGAALYADLLPRLDALGYRTVIAGIALPNDASVRLHESIGMRHVGTFPRAGFKFGRWIDVGYWVRTRDGDDPPAPIMPS